MAWDNLKNQNWNQTSLVRSGHSYEGLFKENIWKGHTRRGTPKLNRMILPTLLRKHRKGEQMKEIFCPWVSDSSSQVYDRLRTLCEGKLDSANKKEDASLVDFLTSSSAKTYFDQAVWGSYGSDWRWVALLTLLKLWTTDLQDVNYSHSDNIFGHDIDGLKLDRLSSPGGDVLFVEDGSNQERVTTITKYSEQRWTVLLQNNNKSDRSDNSLSVTLSARELCIQGVVCLDGSRLGRRGTSISTEMKKFDEGTFGSYLRMLLKAYRYNWDNKRTFMMLAAACFEDIKGVSLTVQKPSKEGQLIFKLMEEKK